MNIEDITICIIFIEGTNMEEESFSAIRRLGAKPEKVHLKQLVSKDIPKKERRKLHNYQILMIPGGFSSGDYVRAGAIFAARMKSTLSKDIKDFIMEGKPILGICNGFQVLVEMGLLPAFDSVMSEVPQSALATNDSARYECRPTLLKHENKGKCVFTRNLEKDKVIMAPCAHTEGKFLFPRDKEEEMLNRLIENDQIVFRYVNDKGDYASYPWNPNGSIYNIAGICNPDGNVFGMMPHPERSFYPYQHPDWTRRRVDELGEGKVVFESVLNYVSRKF